jgi:pimeloyl-ACP methyl ester carboxylesterase
LHGWPHDIHSYVDVAPLLAAEGIGHSLPQEAPDAFAQAVIDVDATSEGDSHVG